MCVGLFPKPSLEPPQTGTIFRYQDSVLVPKELYCHRQGREQVHHGMQEFSTGVSAKIELCGRMFTVYFGEGHDIGMDKRCALFHTNLHHLLGPVGCPVTWMWPPGKLI